MDQPRLSTDQDKGSVTESSPPSAPHLHGWRKAEASYEEAYRNFPDPMLLDKLLATQFLILARQAEEGIYGPFQIERLSALCSRGTTSFHEVLSALFGHGVALHLLGRYETSQRSLDRLLELEPAVWMAIPRESGRSFRARTCYWKAKNHDATGSPEKARKWVNRALADLPRSEAALYLSGILHVEKGEPGLARSEFLKVVDSGTELCDAYYQLGVINQSRPGRDFLFNFMNNAYCRQRKLINLKEKLKGVEGMDLDSARKDEVVDVLQARRHRLREETLASLFNMTKRASSIGELDATAFHQAMDEVWSRISDPER